MLHVLPALCLCLAAVATAGDPLDYRAHEKQNGTIVVEAGELRVEVSKSPWQLSVYDNVTGELIMQDPWNYSPGFGRWEGEYIDVYEGYLWRVGEIREWHQVVEVTNVTYLPDEVLLSATTTSADTTFVCRLTGFHWRQITIKLSLTPAAGWNRLGWAFTILDNDESFFGFGERFNAVNQRGSKVGNWVEEGSFGIGRFVPDIRIPGGKTSTYVPMPLFLSSRGYGFQLNTTYRTEFDSETDKLAMRIMTESSEVAATLFAGRSVRDSFQMMADVNGKPLIPPSWVFGPWNQLTTEESGVNYTERARELLVEEKIPVSVAVENLHFFPEGDDRGQHQALLTRNTQLLYMGLPTMAYFNPMVETAWNETWTELAAKGFFTRDHEGKPYQYLYIAAKLFRVSQIDFTNPGAVQWYQSKLQTALDLKYKGWMYDFGEYTPHDSVNFINQTGLESHNQYPVLYQKACYDVMTRNWTSSKYAPDFMFYHRSGYLGSQRFTWAHWTGDPSSDWTESSGLPAQLKASLSVGVSGLPFSGSDIGGFEWYTGAAPDPELWIRWTQVGAFSGLMHEQGGGKGLGPKSHIFDTPEGIRMWRKFARLRTQLFPYIYTAAHAAHDTGLPLMRHHILDQQLDKVAVSLDDQYMFGDSLLVAPVLSAGQVSRQVYLPSGPTWIDVSSFLRYEETSGQFRIAKASLQSGGGWTQVDSPLETCPFFVRAGTILPTLGPRVLTLGPAAHPNITSMDEEHVLHLWAWTNGSRQALGEDWQRNVFRVFPLSATSPDMALWTAIASPQYTKVITQLAIASTSAHGPIAVQIHGGEQYVAMTSWQQVAFGNSTGTWYYDFDLGTLWIASSANVSQVDIVFEGRPSHNFS